MKLKFASRTHAAVLGVLLLMFFSAPLAVIQAQSPAPTDKPTTTDNATEEEDTAVAPAPAGKAELSIKEFLCTPDITLYNCINRLYRFGIVAGFFIAVLMIVVAGYMYMTGGEKGKEKGKSYISSTFVAITILLTSYLLLNQINPELTKFKKIQPLNVNPEDLDELVKPEDLVTFGDGGENIGAEPPEGGSYSGTFPRFAQKDAPWGSRLYGNCSTTIGASGCGPSSLAEVVMYYKNKGQIRIDPAVQSEFGDQVDPGVMAILAARKGYRVCGSGSSPAMMDGIGKLYGLSAQSASWDAVETALRGGIPVVGHMSGPSLFCGTGGTKSCGHYVVFYSLGGDTVQIADPGPRNRQQADINTVRGAAKGFYIMRPSG
jgi:hypothetical protein